jgi:hypothetical protein
VDNGQHETLSRRREPLDGAGITQTHILAMTLQISYVFYGYGGTFFIKWMEEESIVWAGKYVGHREAGIGWPTAKGATRFFGP